MAPTTEVLTKGGQKHQAYLLSQGIYQSHTFDESEKLWQPVERGAPPIVVVYAETQPTVFADGEGGVDGVPASTWILKNCADDEQIFPRDVKPAERLSYARAAGDHLQTFLPRLMTRKGFERKLIISGYGRLARALTVAFRVECGDGELHHFLITHVMVKLFVKEGKQTWLQDETPEVWTRCIEDIRQLIARAYNNTYGTDLDLMWGRKFEICAALSSSAPKAIRLNMRITDAFLYLLGKHHTIEKAKEHMPSLPSEIFGDPFETTSTKKKLRTPGMMTQSKQALTTVKKYRPDVFKAYIDRFDQLPVRQRFLLVARDDVIQDSIRVVQNDVEREQRETPGSANTYAVSAFFSVHASSEFRANREEHGAMFAFFNDMGTGRLRKSETMLRYSPKEAVPEEDVAFELMLALMSFNYAWQKGSPFQKSFIIPCASRRKGCVVAILLFGASKRQREVGFTNQELTAILKFAGYQADFSWQGLRSRGEGLGSFLTCELIEEGRCGFFKVEQRLLDCHEALSEILSTFLPTDIILRFVQHTAKYSRGFLTQHSDVVKDLLSENHDLNPIALEPLIKDVVSAVPRRARLLQHTDDDWFFTEVVQTHSQHFGEFTQDSKRVEVWWLVVAPWLHYFANQTSQSIPVGVIIAVLAIDHKAGVSPSDYSTLHRIFYGNLSSPIDALTCRSDVRDDDFAVERPETAQLPLLVPGDDGLLHLHPVIEAFFDPENDFQCSVDEDGHWVAQYRLKITALGNAVLQKIQIQHGFSMKKPVVLPTTSKVDEYRRKFELDLEAAASLSMIGWKEMSLLCGSDRRRKTWCIICHHFISNGRVLSQARINETTMSRFNESWDGVTADLDDFLRTVTDVDVREGRKSRRTWRFAKCGDSKGYHLKPMNAGSDLFKLWWH